MFYLPLVVCGYSSHIVVNCWQDGDGLFSHVNSGKDHGRLRDPRQPCGELLGGQMMELQVHVVLLWADTPEELKTQIQNLSSKNIR